MKVTINGEVKEVDKIEVDYFDLLELAGLNKNVIFSMTVSHPEKKAFTMYPQKAAFKLEDGMVINAYYTGGA